MKSYDAPRRTQRHSNDAQNEIRAKDPPPVVLKVMGNDSKECVFAVQ